MTTREIERGDAAQRVVRALQQAMRRRLDDDARTAFGWFLSARGRPDCDVDPGPVAAFVRSRFRDVRALLRRRNDGVRHAAMWALSVTGDARAAAAAVELLFAQRDSFDHDYAYAASKQLGRAGIAPFERLALRSRGLRRTFAIECLGNTRAGVAAVRALSRIVRRCGYADGVLHALHNVHSAAALPLAARALDTRHPQQCSDAMMAVVASLEAASDVARLPGRATVVRRILHVLDDTRTWCEPSDPWASSFAWCLEALALLRAREVVALATRTLRECGSETRRDSARAALAAMRRSRKRNGAAR